jgi:hypothetical protein
MSPAQAGQKALVLALGETLFIEKVWTEIVEKRTSVTIEHTLDLLQVLANLFAGLGEGRRHAYVNTTFGIEHTGVYLLPRLAWWGRLEFEDVVSETTNKIGWGALPCLEKVHGVTVEGGYMYDAHDGAGF